MYSVDDYIRIKQKLFLVLLIVLCFSNIINFISVMTNLLYELIFKN